jgi:hypothetical protein
MLDAPHAGLHRGHRALVAVCMCLHRDSLRRRLLHDRADLVFRVQLLARIGVSGAGAVGRENFDPHDAVRQVHVHRAPQLLDRRHAGHQIRVLGVVQKRLGRQPRPDVVARGHDVGPDRRALLHELVEADVGVARHAGAPHRRHARFQRALKRGDIVGVGMRVDEARQDVLPLQIDRAGGGGRGRGADRFDAAAAQHERRVCRYASGADVDDVGVGEDEGIDGRRLRGRRPRCGDDEAERQQATDRARHWNLQYR